MKKFAVLALLTFTASLLLAQPSPESYSSLRFRYLGPVGNRTDAVAGIPGNPWIYYVGAASGGIFKTTDGGIHWEPIFDGQPVSSIGALAVSPTDPNIVWAGTGEAFIRSHISLGEGIYKSTDAGKTWMRMGLEKTGRIGNVIVDPHNANIVFVCSLGHSYGPQPERGVFRTMDGGKTWDRVLFVDENHGCSDLGMDPNNSQVLYAGMWHLEIHTYGRDSGSTQGGIFRSTDGGATWKKREGHGLPRGLVGRIAVRVAPKDSRRVYALIETGDGVPFNGQPTSTGQLWRSDDGGENWQMVNDDRNIRGRTHYYTREEISPDNENEVYFFSAAFSHTLDGGHTLTPLASSPGGDNHEMWIDPTNADRMAVVNDAGVSISTDHGRTWNHVSLPIAQIYHVTTDNQIPYNVYGNKQDGSSYGGPSNSLQFGFGGGGGGGGAGPISRSVWRPVTGGESGFATADPKDDNIIWSSGSGSGSVCGIVTRYDMRNHQARDVEVWPEGCSGSTAAEVKYRFNWEFPIAISPHDHNRVYVGSQFVHVTTDGGNSWNVISPDLTRQDKSRMGSSGGLTPDNIGVEYAGVVFAIAESPKEAGTLWAGTNDGLVWVKHGSAEWQNVTKNIPGLPDWLTVSNIEASRFDAGTAYIAVDGHQMNNRDAWVFKTNDYGRTWTRITNGIQYGANLGALNYVHCVREDPFHKGLLYAGTENGLYVSFNDGANWQPLQNNLPHAPVYWMTVQEHYHDLAIATYGRGFWVLDDLTPLENFADAQNANAHLFAPRDAYRFRPITQPASFQYDPTAGQNPPFGADINFFLKSAPAGNERARIQIKDAGGKVIRTMTCGVGGGRAAQGGGGRRAAAAEQGTQPGAQTTPPGETPGRPQLAPLGPLAPQREEGAQGPPVCELHAGFNRVYWDLRTDPTPPVTLRTPPLFVPDFPMPNGTRPAPDANRISLLAPPGSYTVTLTVGGQDVSQKLNVLKDPHSTGTEADIQAQTQFVTALRDQFASLTATVNQAEMVRAQLVSLVRNLTNSDAGRQILQAAQQVNDKLVNAEGKLVQLRATGHGQDDVRYEPMLMNRIEYLLSGASSSDFAPTTQQVQVAQWLKPQAEAAQQALQQVLNTDVANFNKVLQEKGIGGIIVKAP